LFIEPNHKKYRFLDQKSSSTAHIGSISLEKSFFDLFDAELQKQEKGLYLVIEIKLDAEI
jgi:hypothetical protein